jgi:hypothetical protein
MEEYLGLLTLDCLDSDPTIHQLDLQIILLYIIQKQIKIMDPPVINDENNPNASDVVHAEVYTDIVGTKRKGGANPSIRDFSNAICRSTNVSQ